VGKLVARIFAMNDIRAFVGHSFTKDDEAVVGAFIKHFERLQQSPINFSWVHAEPAEPKDLAVKVLRLMNNKNVFIGICTRKERSVSNDELRPTHLPPGFLKAPKDKFLWKTSDWIIQEIGLAIGKGLEIILLLEAEVQKPGGLQGNIEYIYFDRDNPEQSFDKILEMISSLSPKLPTAVTSTSDPRSTPGEEQAETEPPNGDWWKPQPGWSELGYESSLKYVIEFGNNDQIDEVTAAYMKSENASRDDNKQRWKALIEYNKLAYGKNGSIANLKLLVDADPKSSGVREQLARAFAHFGELREAGRKYQEAADKATTPQAKLRLLEHAARAFVEAKDDADTLAVISRIKGQVQEAPDTELQALRALAGIAKLKEDYESLIPLRERILELTPDDHETRFGLAYAYSKNSNNILALLHYSVIPEHERRAAGWNNLGVACDEVELPGQAVEALRNSESANGTLAMSTLATKFLKAGFLTEAMALCEKALKLEDPHKNIGLTWSKLKGLPDEERKRREELLAKARPISDFYRQTGGVLMRPQPNISASGWDAPGGPITVIIKGDSFAAEGSYEQAGLFGSLGFGIFSNEIPTKVKYRVTYSGTISGHTIRGTVYRRREDEDTKQTTLLAGKADRPEVLMVLTDDERELRVMEDLKSSEPKFYSLRRKDAVAAGAASGG
jgi:tetratricopeptide (TPR) repeat protein